MESAFSLVVGAFVAALERAPAVCSTIYRARERAIPDGIDKAINVQFDGARPNRGAINLAPVDWQVQISVECFAKGLADSGDIAVDPLLVATYARIASDSTLGGLVDDVGEPNIETENSAEGRKAGWIRLTYIVELRTQQLRITNEN